MASSESRQISEFSGRDEIHLNRLVYRFDRENPWQYFRDGIPLSSSVERGLKKTSAKMTKIYVNKRRGVRVRKNRSYSDIANLSLVCSCHQGCLLRHGAIQVRQIIRQQRQKVFQKSYNEQNYILSKLLEVNICLSGRRRISYRIPPFGKVCKGAFKKCYGISDMKLKVLLKKMDEDGVSVEADMRGKHGNKPRSLLPEAKKTVIDFILSHKASESHYRRAHTAKRYFDSHESMRKMWLDFLAKNPSFKTNRSTTENRGPVISYSTFRSIFNEDLRALFSFRRSREDTCQFCDQQRKKIEHIEHLIEAKSKGHNTGGNLEELKGTLSRYIKEHEEHKRESEVRFAALKYDMLIMTKSRTVEN